MGSPWIRPHSLFSKIFNGRLFVWSGPCECSDQIWSPYIASWDWSDWSFGFVERHFPTPPVANLGEEEAVGGSGMVPFEWALVTSYRPPIVTFVLILRVSEILPLLCSSMPLFPTSPLVSPPQKKNSLCYPGSRCMTFGLRRAQMLR